MSRVPGHELISEGQPFRADGTAPLNAYGRTGGKGHGKCSCGALSTELDSGAKRKQWHRTHKAEILAAQPDGERQQ